MEGFGLKYLESVAGTYCLRAVFTVELLKGFVVFNSEKALMHCGDKIGCSSFLYGVLKGRLGVCVDWGKFTAERYLCLAASILPTFPQQVWLDMGGGGYSVKEDTRLALRTK